MMAPADSRSAGPMMTCGGFAMLTMFLMMLVSLPNSMLFLQK